ncbi:unnamed protein product [Rotaria magnacalcarata]|uniref:Uncharacterized protein n=1 Tax=Rotaria magnacalcarata TaxID=392030 RepID=A0A814TX85_9BILA|nr:unnamed protein product [Rotaria magnacalcarata]
MSPLKNEQKKIKVLEQQIHELKEQAKDLYLQHEINEEQLKSAKRKQTKVIGTNYCVKLPLGSLGQVGWATIGFIVDTSNGIGIGDDGYSWCFDGSRGTSYNNGDFQFLLANVRWKKNNVCGCGIIEINGEITRIKYWLNSKFLGTSFAH